MVSSLSLVVNDEPLVRYVVPSAQNLQYLPTGPPLCSARDEMYYDFGAQIVDGVVWFWLLGQWQDLPSELWAWKQVAVWTAGHYYHQCSLWVPSLLLFDFWEYNRSTYTPVLPSVVGRQPGPSATAIIAPQLSQILCNYGDSKLRRTCRLVCWDWAKALPFGEPGLHYLRYEDGAVWYWIEEEWRHLPHKYWAWKLHHVRGRWEIRLPRWSPELVQPVDDSIRRGPKYSFTPSSTLLPSGVSRKPGFSRATALPQELFKSICNQADSYSWSLRLVSRYWSRQCQPKIFKETSARTPERIHELWTHRMDPLMQQLELIREVPAYNRYSQFPWLHRLTQLCDSTRSVWINDGVSYLCGMLILGPFGSKFGHIRSVHFALPRSLPRSLSRGIKRLHLIHMDFRRFADLTHLVCELPDLEELDHWDCNYGNVDPPPIELPRRPRTNRNKLSKIRVRNEFDDKTEFLPSALTLFLSVYAVPSFFSEGELAVSLALLQLLRPRLEKEVLTVRYEDHLHDHSRRIVYFPDIRRGTVFSLHILQDPTRTHTILSIIADCRYAHTDEDLAHWIRLDTEFSKITDLIHRAECVFGFGDHRTMVRFATNILAKMPSISRRATIRYSIWKEQASKYQDKWFRASLDSEELTGPGEEDLAKVYL